MTDPLADVQTRLDYLSMVCANPSDGLSAGLWCEAANEGLMLACKLAERLAQVEKERDEAQWQTLDEFIALGDFRLIGLRVATINEVYDAVAEFRRSGRWPEQIETRLEAAMPSLDAAFARLGDSDA